jgi:translocation and assembly module TamB
LFIITDSRSIKFIAKKSLESTKFEYQTIEGNLFKGLEVKGLTYDKKEIFKTAQFHWNPLRLLSHTLSISDINVEGIEIDHIVSMVEDLSKSKRKNKVQLDFSLSIGKSHFDINPYVFEGVKFSDFELDTARIELSKELLLNSKKIDLKFDSDLVNIELKGEIDENKLMVENLNLYQISSKDITRFVQRLLAKNKKNRSVAKKKSSKPFAPFEVIKVKHITATMKPVEYGDLKIKKVTMLLDNGVIDPYNGYNYTVEKLKFKGKTNFANVHYKGYIKNSTIQSKGEILLNKELFRKYSLPLNFKNLQKLPSKLKLNHSGVWVDIDHEVKELLAIENDFNIDVSKGHHEISYIYAKDLIVESKLKGAISYADDVNLDIKTVVNFKQATVKYRGDATLDVFKKLPPVVSDYLLTGLHGKFSGDKKGLEVELDTHLLQGKFMSSDYKTARLELNSKGNNIYLSRIVNDIGQEYASQTFSLRSNTSLDFKDMSHSSTVVNIYSNLLNVKAEGMLSLPAQILLSMEIPEQSKFRMLNSKIKFEKLKNLKTELFIDNDIYKIKVHDQHANMNFSIDYNAISNSVENARIVLDNEVIELNENKDGLVLHSKIADINSFLKSVGNYYDLGNPPIEGAVELDIQKRRDGLSFVHLRSKKLTFLKDTLTKEPAFNLYDLDTHLKIDKAFNIEMKKYKFNIEENPYFREIYATKSSYFTFKESKFILKELWLNDEIKLMGDYDLSNEQGNFSVEAEAFRFQNKDFDLNLNLDLLVKVKAEKVNVEGDINILGNAIHYDLEGSSIVEDADIIIVQEEREKAESPLRNLKLYVKIHNKNPLHYDGKDTSIEFYNELSIVKNYNQDMMITGMSTITKGYYQLEDKRFDLDESHLYFAGDVRKPLLDIKANYEKEQYNVHIFISGTTETPIVNFNSEPYLTQQEILSLILFDGTGSSSGKGAEAYTLLGGTFAKGLIKSLGIDVDHLLLGTNEKDELSLEIGRKISEDITVLYLHKDGLDGAKVMVEHSDSFQTDIIIQPPNTSSIEFLYKQDR